MYLLKKQLDFLPVEVVYYHCQRENQGNVSRYFFGTNPKPYQAGTFHRFKAKIFRYKLHAIFVNLFFGGIIERVYKHD